METDDVYSSPAPKRRHINFVLQLAFVAFVCTLASVYYNAIFAVDSDPPPKPSRSVSDLEARAGTLDGEYRAAMKRALALPEKSPERAKADADAHSIGDLRNEADKAVEAALEEKTQYRNYYLFKLGRTAIFPIVVDSFFLVVYYGTSFDVTPFRIFLPWLFKRTASPTRFDADPGPPLSPNDILSDSVRNATKLATRMERRTNTHLILGVTMGLLGVSVWLVAQTRSDYVERSQRELQAYQLHDEMLQMRLRDLPPDIEYRQRLEYKERLDDLDSQLRALRLSYSAPQESVGTILSRDLVSLLPRLTILLFIEVLAGFFLRQYRIGVEDLKYFLDLERKAKARSIAYSIYNQYDSAAKMGFAAAILEETSQIVLKDGESTTTVKVIEAEKNEFIQALDVAAKQLTGLSDLARKAAKA